jgi:dienelactone hydrolase
MPFMPTPLRTIISILAVVSLSVSVMHGQDDTELSVREQTAVTFVEQMARQEFDAAVMGFDSTMSSVMPAQQLRETWDAVEAQAGRYLEWTGTRQAEFQGYHLVFVVSRFELTVLDIRVVFDGENRIAGLFFQPHQQDQPADSAAIPNGVTERDVTVGEEPWRLPGTLALPAGSAPVPGVVLVHGSGPNDRDETVGGAKPFRDLAWGLAARGIAVLRYEKRTREYRERLTGNTREFTVEQEVVEDALAAVALLQADDRVDAARVFVLGHSLGGMLAPRIGTQDATIAGLVVMAGPARPLEALIADQILYLAELDGEVTPVEQVRMEQLEQEMSRVATLTEADTASGDVLLGASPAYWLDLRAYDPVETARSLTLPMLFLHGGRDYQVTKVDFDLWRAALQEDPRVTLLEYPALNHLFVAGEGPSEPAEYQEPGHVAPEVIADIANWIHGIDGDVVD